ncbi:DNA polymerase alpha catalytic subunit isoform X1 [Amaranthus tricolor]|uniref:DNA polymerase alpha catalytic subunit isoform X1 n=1 Tax=Amaranthus tricolor TaxID=29722 RepID=UPI00258BD123|nr:DNA polymerase alpha catalytic subunit isoform X1 [Amaranthus tricolor]
MEDDNQPTVAGRRRSRGSNAATSARSQALERLKALRRGESRPSYDIKIDAPIYDTVDEDEYKTLVAKRREEFSDFIVGDVNDGYIDDGEEEDWTKAGLSFSSDEEDGEEGEKIKKKKKEKVEKEKKPSATANALSAAAAMMGKQRISKMFTTSVFKKRNEEKISCDSVVDDIIAECMPDDVDRERRRRPQSKNLGLGVGFGINKVDEKPVNNCYRKTDDVLNCGLAKTIEEINDKVCVEKNMNDLGLLDDEMKEFEHRDMNEKVESVVELKDEPVLKEEEQQVFAFNAKIKEEKIQAYSAAVEWQAISNAREGNGEGVKPVESGEEKPNFVLESDGSLPFYIIDAYEEIYGANSGTIYLFGKVKAGNAYHSCCVVVKNMLRCLYAIPSSSVFHNEVVLKLEKDAADNKISATEFQTKLHEVASGLKTEVAKHLMDLNVSTFSMAPVKRSYAFERFDIPHGENYALKINYPFKDPPLPSHLKGDTLFALFGTHTSALELFLVKRKIKGPSWLSISKFSSCSSHSRVSWCKFEIIVDSPKDIQVSTSTKNTVEIPPVIVTSINLKTIINEKQNINEIVSASIISCNKVKIDTPMLGSEWKRPGVLNHFTVVRKLDGGIYPVGFTKEAAERNLKAGNTVLTYASSERALLLLLMAELHKSDSDVLVGHNISGFDLDILLHRVQACRVSSSVWSKIGRLKRATMPKLTKGSSVFGSGASPGIMSCIAGRLLCDTYLCSRDLLKEVSYSLTQLAKSQLNKDRKEIAPKDIPEMYQTTESLVDLIECNQTDAWLSLELMFHLSILPLTRQLTNISGNLWGKTLQGARAQRVEYLLLHAFHAKKYIVPDKISSRGKDHKLTKRKTDNDGNIDVDNVYDEIEAPQEDRGKSKKGPAYAGGLVLEPKKGLFDKYVLLLDFNSLYPSIIQEYNICFTTVERYPDGSVPRMPSSEKTGVLPELLKNLVERRRMVKSWLKTASGLKAQQFDIQQQALKLTANSMYGCLGFSNSRFYAKPLAELITLQGREILQSTVDLVQNILNLEVIYGDTDSIMIYSGLDDIAKAKAIAGKVIQEVNKKYRCLEIDLDGLYKRMLLLKKKKYAAVKLQFRDGTPYEVIERKGLDMVRRDWSLLSKELGDFCLSQILSGGSCEDVVEAIHSSLMKVQEEMRKGEVPLEKYIIRKSLTKPPEDYPDAKNQPHVQVALRLKQNGYSSGCSVGDTVPYIICCEQGTSLATSGGIAQRARHPDELKRDNSQWMIDIDYYLSQQIHPVVSRLCASIQGTDPARLGDCLGLDSSKFQSKCSHINSNDPSSSLLFSVNDEDRYQNCQPLSLSCPTCFETLKCPSIFSSLYNTIAEKPNEAKPEESTSNFWQRLRCPKCPEEGDVGRISPAMIANQVKRQADGFISTYYRGLMTCDDVTCKYTTRSLNLRVIGDSERGTICPNYPLCNGHLEREYSEADLYKQLTYFCHILDTVRCIKKVDAAARLSLEKELIRIRTKVNLGAALAQKLQDRCAYGWVQLNDLFVTL